MKEKIAEFPSYCTKYLDDVIGGDGPDLDPIISDISEQQKSYSESEPKVQNYIPTWARQTLSFAGDNIGNLDDPRRTRYDSKEQVLHSLVLIICCLNIVI